jgi:integrase/recombinase XerD
MSVFDSFPTAPPVLAASEPLVDEAQLAAVAFLARYRGRTLDSYRADLHQCFQWAEAVGVPPLQASRAHIELYRAWLDERGLAASTVDRRLSTVCGYYRFAHIDGRIGSNPAQYVRRSRVDPTTQRGVGSGRARRLLVHPERISPTHAALAVLLGLNGLRVSEARSVNVEDLRSDRRHRTLRIVGKGNKPAPVPLVPRPARTVDLAIDERTAGPILRRHDGRRRLNPRTAHRWVQAIGRPAGLEHVHPHVLRAAFIMAALDAGVPSTSVLEVSENDAREHSARMCSYAGSSRYEDRSKRVRWRAVALLRPS